MAEVINQTLIPKIKLSSGEEIPCVGMGTFGSDRFTAEQVSNAVAGAIRCGSVSYTHLDVYKRQAYRRYLSCSSYRNSPWFLCRHTGS